MNDDELIRRWREGDEDAFWELRRRHRPECFDDKNAPTPNWLYRIDRRQLWRFITDFENLFDEVLRKTASRGGYDPARGTPYRAYLGSSLKNAVWSWLRGEDRRERLALETDLGSPDDEGNILDRWSVPHVPPGAPAELVRRIDRLRRALKRADPAWEAEMKDLLEFVMGKIKRLSQADQDTINRRFRDEQDYAEIANAYGISEEDCRKNRLWRALNRLRDLCGGPQSEE